MQNETLISKPFESCVSHLTYSLFLLNLHKKIQLILLKRPPLPMCDAVEKKLWAPDLSAMK